MKPDPAAVLADLAATLMTGVAPLLPPYEGASTGLSAALIGMVAEESDRAAHRRVEENRAIRALFAAAQGVLADGDLAARLARLAEGADEDLHIAALDASNAELRAAFIDLHAAVEGQGGEPARRLEAEIWRELAASTERRRLSSATV